MVLMEYAVFAVIQLTFPVWLNGISRMFWHGQKLQSLQRVCGSGTQKLVGRLFILYFLRLDGNMCNLQFGTRGLRILSGIGIPL